MRMDILTNQDIPMMDVLMPYGRKQILLPNLQMQQRDTIKVFASYQGMRYHISNTQDIPKTLLTVVYLC